MEFKKWKEDNRWTCKHLAEKTGIHEARMHRILNGRSCVKLADAHKIVIMTKGEVDYADLLTGDC